MVQLLQCSVSHHGAVVTELCVTSWCSCYSIVCHIMVQLLQCCVSHHGAVVTVLCVTSWCSCYSVVCHIIVQLLQCNIHSTCEIKYMLIQKHDAIYIAQYHMLKKN